MKLEQKDRKISGFELPDGVYRMKVGEPSFGKDEDGEATDVLRVPLIVVEGEHEGGMASVFCNMDKKFGRRVFATLLGITGVADKLEQKFKLNANLTPAEWADKYLDIKNDKSLKLINQAIVWLVDTEVMAEIKNVTVKTKDGEERNFTRVVEIDKVGSVVEPKVEKKKDSDEEESEDW